MARVANFERVHGENTMDEVGSGGGLAVEPDLVSEEPHGCCPECSGNLIELPHGPYSILECVRGCGWWDEKRPVKKWDDAASSGDRLGAAMKWAVAQWAESRAPRCDICGELDPHKLKWGGRKALARDHCHKTNLQRGRLCTRCNTGLGFFRDDPRLLLNAMDYLRRYRMSDPTSLQRPATSRQD